MQVKMKNFLNMKRNLIKFYAQLSIVGTLATLGLVALCGEPTEDANFLAVFSGQIAVVIFTWTLAYLLSKRWQIIRKIEATGLFQ